MKVFIQITMHIFWNDLSPATHAGPSVITYGILFTILENVCLEPSSIVMLLKLPAPTRMKTTVVT